VETDDDVVLGDALRPETLQTLKDDARACFNGAFFMRLEEAEASILGDGGKSKFFDVVIRRLKRVTSIHA